ncbi:menaquinone biosynthetic enzyme MqnA/MqnD family protein [Desulfoluna butyratoxydans]|uniref:Chorismate dehydratase n=1 Tax=Desulfoluna butyratoxydans TaxID=231438 RepID=A0A4U8YS64_9BACT|nr:menaquinone biosynthesis protein [Desulfoluna butyratoxydans]VFQ47186.1 menaquinone biosynthesis enzyme [Desulfoluna butyratoxydans]
MSKIPIGRISYINVSPVYHGIDHGDCPAWLSMVTEPPATLNAMLRDGEVVMSPVSSVAYARNADQWLLLPDLSIACDGKVLSVLFVSDKPMEFLDGDRVMVTEESATSVELLRILLRKKGGRPVIEPGRVHDPSDLPEGVKGALVIGDSALLADWHGRFPYVYDLGMEWKQMTGLPFVFAVWAIRKDFCAMAPAVVDRLVELFHRSRAAGLTDQHGIVTDAHAKTGLSRETLTRYFNHLVVSLGDQEIKGLSLYFEQLYRYGLLPKKVVPAFASSFETLPSREFSHSMPHHRAFAV